MKKSISVSLLLTTVLIPQSTFPTCILSDIFQNHIYITADTKESFQGKGKERQVCKIKKVGNYYYTPYGQGAGYLFYAADSFLQKSEPTPENVTKFAKTLVNFFNRLIYDTASFDPDSLRKLVGGPVGGVCFYYFKDGKPQINDAKVFLRYANRKYSTVDFNSMSSEIFWWGMQRKELEVLWAMQFKYTETWRWNLDAVKQIVAKYPKTDGEPVDEIEISPDNSFLWKIREDNDFNTEWMKPHHRLFPDWLP